MTDYRRNQDGSIEPILPPEPRRPDTPREAALRAELRRMMGDCPACSEELADDIPPNELERWISSHRASGH